MSITHFYRGLKVCTAWARAVVWASALAGAAATGQTSESGATLDGEPFIYGAATCSTSGCHGGAEPKREQYTIWSRRDAHARAYATLTTARSARMGEALGIADVTTSTRCTACHAPLNDVKRAAPHLLDDAARATEGVSCVSCHGPGGDWVRSHTRTDFTHEQKVAAGLKNVRDPYARANTCVACHQVIDPELVTKGRHPRLVFELDGQTASQPRHWIEQAAGGYSGARAWEVGQAVALREVSRALRERAAGGGASVEEFEKAEEKRWEALVWVLKRWGGAPGGTVGGEPTTDNLARVQAEADKWARAAAGATFDASGTSVTTRLKALAATHREFADKAADREAQAYRAERLVLALDRLWKALPMAQRGAGSGVSSRLDALFAQVQSIPGFSPEKFGRELAAFEEALP